MIQGWEAIEKQILEEMQRDPELTREKILDQLEKSMQRLEEEKRLNPGKYRKNPQLNWTMDQYHER